MKLTASQDRDAIGGWIEGQADRAEGKRILGDRRLGVERGVFLRTIMVDLERRYGM